MYFDVCGDPNCPYKRRVEELERENLELRHKLNNLQIDKRVIEEHERLYDANE